MRGCCSSGASCCSAGSTRRSARCAELEPGAGPARLAAVAALVGFELALRRRRAEQARWALAGAREAAARSGIGALRAEVEQAGGPWSCRRRASSRGARSGP